MSKVLVTSSQVTAVLLLAQDALFWCSGSSDFNEGGQARRGWLAPRGPLAALNAITDLLELLQQSTEIQTTEEKTDHV